MGEGVRKANKKGGEGDFCPGLTEDALCKHAARYGSRRLKRLRIFMTYR